MDVNAQTPTADSLRRAARLAPTDTQRCQTLVALANELAEGAHLPDSALAVAKRALQLAGRSPYHLSLAEYCLGITAYYNNLPEAAFRHLEAAARHARAAAEPRLEAKALFSIASLHHLYGDLAMALESFKRCLEILRHAPDSSLQANCYVNLGLTHMNMGNHPQALFYLKQSARMFQNLAKPVMLASAYNNIGILFFEENKFDKSEQYYLSALEIYDSLAYARGQAETNLNLGNIAFERSDWEAALRHYGAAAEYAIQEGSANMQAHAYSNSGFVYLRQGRWQESIRLSKLAIAISDSIGALGTQARAESNLAEAHFAQGRLAEANAFAKAAIKTALESEEPKLIYEIAETNARLDSAMGNWKSAFLHHRLYAQYRDSVFSQKKAQEIGRLEAQFEFEDQQEQARQAQAAAQARLHRRNALQYTAVAGIIAFMLLGVLFSARLRVGRRWAGMLVFASFILTYEFILVVLDPFMEARLPGPAWRLALNAMLAVLIAPLHMRLEQRMRRLRLPPAMPKQEP